MRVVWLSICLLVACKGGSTHETTATGVNFAEVLQRLAAFQARVCACASPACADGVEVEYKQYRQQVGAALERVPEDPIFDEKAATIARAFRVCREAQTDKIAASLRALAAHRDTICTCHDVACAERAHAAYEAWSLDEAKTITPKEVDRMTPVQHAEVNRTSRDLRDCLEQLRRAAR